MIFRPVDVPGGLYAAGGYYIDLPAVLALGYKYTIIVSMRGGGKTYGALKYCTEHEEPFMYFRRNLKSLKMCASPAFHIFRPLNAAEGRDVKARFDNSLEIGYFSENDTLVGYAVNLSTFAGIRSIGSASALGVKWLIFDEFIPQPDEIKRYDLFEAWRQAEETLVRNEAITGEEPRRLLMANADTIRGDIVRGYKIGDAYMKMQEEGIEAAAVSDYMLLVRPGCAELAEAKQHTALYEVSDDNGVMLRNEFLIEDRQKIGKRALSEYVARCSYSGICVYKHKTRPEYYISLTASGKPKTYGEGAAEHRRFIRDNTAVWKAYMRDRIYYESVQAQTLFLRIYDEY